MSTWGNNQKLGGKNNSVKFGMKASRGTPEMQVCGLGSELAACGWPPLCLTLTCERFKPSSLSKGRTSSPWEMNDWVQILGLMPICQHCREPFAKEVNAGKEMNGSSHVPSSSGDIDTPLG